MLVQGSLHEGITSEDTRSGVKSEMIRQIRHLKQTTPKEWQRATFSGLAGAFQGDVDWNLEDNKAGAFTWIKSFDQLIEELIDDGYVKLIRKDGSRTLVVRDDVEHLHP